MTSQRRQYQAARDPSRRLGNNVDFVLRLGNRKRVASIVGDDGCFGAAGCVFDKIGTERRVRINRNSNVRDQVCAVAEAAAGRACRTQILGVRRAQGLRVRQTGSLQKCEITATHVSICDREIERRIRSRLLKPIRKARDVRDTSAGRKRQANCKRETISGMIAPTLGAPLLSL